MRVQSGGEHDGPIDPPGGSRERDPRHRSVAGNGRNPDAARDQGNPVSELAWEDHIPADWPARALLWMCSAEADTYCGEEISLRDEGIRKAIGLV